MFARSGRRRSAAGLLVIPLLVLAGCGAAEGPFPDPSQSSAAPTPRVTGAPTPPAGSVTLASLGFTNGPVASVYVPGTATITDRVDQPNAVTVVFAAPPAAELLTFFEQALPAGGFTLDHVDRSTATLTFSGHGWSGSFTGSDTASALTLGPS